MTYRYFVKELTDEGRLVAPENDYHRGIYFNRFGYENEKEAELVIEEYFKNDPYCSMDLVIVKIYTKNYTVD